MVLKTIAEELALVVRHVEVLNNAKRCKLKFLGDTMRKPSIIQSSRRPNTDGSYIVVTDILLRPEEGDEIILTKN